MKDMAWEGCKEISISDFSRVVRKACNVDVKRAVSFILLQGSEQSLEVHSYLRFAFKSAMVVGSSLEVAKVIIQRSSFFNNVPGMGHCLTTVPVPRSRKGSLALLRISTVSPAVIPNKRGITSSEALPSSVAITSL